MRKLLPILLMISLIFIFGSCGKKSDADIIKSLGEKIEEINGYEVDAVMDVIEMNKSHLFDVNIKYLKPDLFKITLKNRDSNNVQIILKNEEGVFVLTPALNKSFKFQSDWPYNSSQPYLYQSLVKDIINDKDTVLVKRDGNIEITTKVNYRRSNDLNTQKIIIDEKTLFPKEVIVFDINNNEKIKVMFNEVKFKPKFHNDEFKLEYCMNDAKETFKDILPTFNNRNIMYPTNMIGGFTLVDEIIKDIDSGKRAIMTFEGVASFTVVEEYLDVAETFSFSEIIYGDPIIICSGIAFQTHNTLTWIDNGIEFFIISETLDADDLYLLANSFTVQAEK